MTQYKYGRPTPYSIASAHNFSTTDHRIYPAEGDEPVPNDQLYKITLTAKLDSVEEGGLKYLQLYYLEDTYKRDKEKDGSLDLRIPPGGCRYQINLDPSIDWKFRHNPSVKLDRDDDCSNDAMTMGGAFGGLYPRLYHNGPQEIWFDANYKDVEGGDDVPATPYPFSFYVSLAQYNGARAIVLKIDPDILNPGDHGHPLTTTPR